ncbi:hypothetical protein [Tautonia plasticadhaerens]|uniref:Uncharacterized protein n=1 Tax=Tautonia plasticadhaerens TaxID=2527974 RepID=A0A518HD79_9BACT|nr:hypothetical protein [Tautonia plasticadhaerens]QDV38815.1 hypothetical protein ElP_67720 [Tautonia plasticadhaerens]
MSIRIGFGVGAASAALAWAIFGGAPVGPGRVGASPGPQDVSPGVGPLGEGTPRSKAAQRIAELMRGGVEVDVQQVVDGLPGAEDLARRRSEIADQLMEFALVKFVEPPSPTAQRGTFHAAIIDYVEWSSKRLDASLELAGSDDDRREALAGEVGKLRSVEQAYRELAEAEGIGVTPQNLLELEFLRLGVESRLARLVAGRGD